MKKTTLKDLRNDSKYVNALVLKGNTKLLDYDDNENNDFIRYAQFSTRALKDCPFKSAGCTIACYATKGLHNFPSVKENRKAAKLASENPNFAENMIFTIETEFKSARYAGKHMMLRLHESGDFYSVEYLEKWIDVFTHFLKNRENHFTTCFYTKSFEYFLSIDDSKAAVINECLDNNIVAMSFSIDDTTSTEQIARLAKCMMRFPKANIYYCTENVESVKRDSECDCANCAKCAKCTKTSGKTVAVKIHSVNEKELAQYHKNAMKKH